LSTVLKRLRIDRLPALDTIVKAEGTASNHFGDLFGNGRAVGTLMLWGTFIGVCAVVSFFSQSLTYLYTQAGKSNSLGVDAMAAYSTGAILGGLLLPLFARRWHANRVLMVAIFAACAATVVQGLVLPMTDAINLTLAGLCGAFVSGSFFILYPPAVRFYPTAIRSTGIGAAVAFGRIGNIVTPLLSGLMLGAGYSATNIFLTMALPLMISLVALAVFHRISTRAENQAETEHVADNMPDTIMRTAPRGSAPGSAAA
jgi:MFS family permease